jgi:hypothetical protein
MAWERSGRMRVGAVIVEWITYSRRTLEISTSLVSLVDLVCFVYLVDLVHLVGFVQPKTRQTR